MWETIVYISLFMLFMITTLLAMEWLAEKWDAWLRRLDTESDSCLCDDCEE